MERDYLAFWNDGELSQASVVKVVFPPHEAPRGGVLEELIIDALCEGHPRGGVMPELTGAVELSPWSPGAYREIAVGDGRVGSLECTGGCWRVHL